MPLPQKHRFIPFTRAGRTLDGMYARIDATISDLLAAPPARQGTMRKPVTLQPGRRTHPIAGRRAS